MSESISEIQQEYLRSQSRYDHRDDLPPPNTLAVHQIQHEWIVRTVRKYAAHHDVHMLDVGCGWGDFSNQLDPLLKSYVGVEPSPIELDRFQKRPHRFLVHGVGEHLEFLKDNSRNFILLNSVLDHCYNWRETYANSLRVLAPGGLIIVSMENSKKLITRARRLFDRKQVHHGHLEFFAVDETRKLLEQDFKIQDTRTIGFLFGMHAVTKRVPLPVGPLRLLNRIVNGAFRFVAPDGGHIFFIAGIRNGSPSPDSFLSPFRCPKCKTSITFGDATCGACGLPLPYSATGYLDYVEINSTLKSVLNP